jgi:hypothetical protein
LNYSPRRKVFRRGQKCSFIHQHSSTSPPVCPYPYLSIQQSIHHPSIHPFDHHPSGHLSVYPPHSITLSIYSRPGVLGVFGVCGAEWGGPKTPQSPPPQKKTRGIWPYTRHKSLLVGQKITGYQPTDWPTNQTTDQPTDGWTDRWTSTLIVASSRLKMRSRGASCHNVFVKIFRLQAMQLTTDSSTPSMCWLTSWCDRWIGDLKSFRMMCYTPYIILFIGF